MNGNFKLSELSCLRVSHVNPAGGMRKADDAEVTAEITSWGGFMRYAELDLGDEDRLADYLKELIIAGDLQDAALGIAKRFVAQGYESLSDRQKYVLDQHIIDVYVTQRCERCGEKIDWEEMYFAYHNGGYCGYCHRMYESMQRE